MSSSVYLPDDITVLQILVKVACVKFVLRCTSICKSWCSIIKSPLFINLHLNGPKTTKYLLCDYSTNSNLNLQYLSLQHDTEAFLEHYRLVFPSKLRYGATIRGCCNGLICYTRDQGGNIYVWNPAIRKLKVLPKYPDYSYSPIFEYHSYEDSFFRLGFGFWFDKRMNDYMVAVISYTNRASFVDIYSFSSNSWRIISHSIPGMFATRAFEHVEGTLHWPAERNTSYMIYSLDIETGMFRETLLPLPYDSDTKLDIKLTAIGKHSLAVSGSKINRETRRCFIVLVYDHNLNKLYTIDLEKDTCHVLRPMAGLRNNGEALFPKLDLDDPGIVTCNIETKVFEEIDYDVMAVERYDCKYQWNLQRVEPFIETLVLLNDRHAKNTSTPRYEETDFKGLHLFV